MATIDVDGADIFKKRERRRWDVGGWYKDGVWIDTSEHPLGHDYGMPTQAHCAECTQHLTTIAARDAEIAELKKSVEFLAIDGTQRINDAEDIAERAEAQVAELRKDAERYRWLKDNICPIFMLKRKPIYGVSAYIYSVKMDAQIDAAMEESKR